MKAVQTVPQRVLPTVTPSADLMVSLLGPLSVPRSADLLDALMDLPTDLLWAGPMVVPTVASTDHQTAHLKVVVTVRHWGRKKAVQLVLPTDLPKVLHSVAQLVRQKVPPSVVLMVVPMAPHWADLMADQLAHCWGSMKAEQKVLQKVLPKASQLANLMVALLALQSVRQLAALLVAPMVVPTVASTDLQTAHLKVVVTVRHWGRKKAVQLVLPTDLPKVLHSVAQLVRQKDPPSVVLMVVPMAPHWAELLVARMAVPTVVSTDHQRAHLKVALMAHRWGRV